MGIYKRKDSPFWWMLIEASGKKQSTGIPWNGASPAQDREQERRALAHYAKAQAAAVLNDKAPQKPAIRFRDFAEWYETHVAAHHRSAERERSMLRQLAKGFGASWLAEVDEPAVREWMTTRATQVERSTVNRELDVLKALLRAAVPKYLDAPPLSNVRRFRVKEEEPRVLKIDEETRLLAVCNPEEKALILTALDTLLRLSSCLRLEWPQVKLDRRVILPLNAKVATDAKPISTRLHAALAALPRSERYVFSTFHRGRGETAAKNNVIRRFAELCADAGIAHGRARAGLTFHCLRHTGATRALQRGASLRTVMKLGGWKNAVSVLRYLHAADTDVIAAAESIGNYVEPA